LLRRHAQQRPGETLYAFLPSGQGDPVSITHARLEERARQIAAYLRAAGLTANQPGLLLFQPGIDYICAFFSCQYAGAIPVPAYPPTQVRQLARLQSIIDDAGLQPGAAAHTLVLDYGQAEALETIRQHANELAAVLVEPVQSRRPDFQPREFLYALGVLTRDHGITLIFDEIITGFRLHPGGAQSWYEVRCDLVTYGKVVGGGMPAGMVAGPAAYLDAVDGGQWQYGDQSYPGATTTFFAGTFCKHPLMLAAARAVLQKLVEAGPQLQQQLNDRTARLASQLNAVCAEVGIPLRVVHCGSLFRFDTAHNVDLLFYQLLERGLYIWEGRNMFLSTAHSEADITRIVEIFTASARALRGGGILSRPAARGAEPTRKSSPAPAVPTAVAVAAPAPASNDAGTSAVAVSGDRQQFGIALTEAQRGVWFECQLDAEAALSYNTTTVVRLRGILDETALQHAFQRIVARHSALRTVFSEDGTYQYVLQQRQFELPVLDLTGQAGAAVDASIHAWLVANDHRRIDLSEGPLMYAHLLRTRPDERLLAMTFHHLAADGLSQVLLLQELSELYNAALARRAASLPQVIPFAAYVREQQAYLGSAKFAADAAYWLERFAGAVPEPVIPSSFRRSRGGSSSRAKLQQLTISAERCTQLQRVGHKLGCTLFMTMFASTAVLLHRLTQQPDLVIAIPMMAGRSVTDQANLLGYTLNLIPLRCRWEGNPSFAAYLGTIRESLIEAYAHADYPFGQLLRKLKLSPDPRRRSLAPVLFNLNRAITVPQLHGLEGELLSSPVNFGSHDLAVDVIQLPDRLDVQFKYNVDAFESADIERLVDCFTRLLEGIVADPGCPIGALPILTEAQLNQFIR